MTTEDRPGLRTRSDSDVIDVLAGEHADIATLFERVSSPDEDRPAVLKALLQGLANHVGAEKQMLVPVLKDRVEDGPTLAAALTRSHDEVERVLTLLERRKVNSPDVPDLVGDLIDLHESHVSNADQTIFPALRAALGDDELSALGATLVSDERHMLTHSHPALPDAGPIAALSRKAAAVIDRFRDHSADLGRTTG